MQEQITYKELGIEYYLSEGYPQELAELYTEQDLQNGL